MSEPSTDAGRRPAPPSGVVVAQRLSLVLPSSGEFDSRAWRIATALAARGHHVTVLARSEAGLPDHQRDPSGYDIVRVPVSAVAGLPRLLRPFGALRRRGSAPAGMDAGSLPEPAGSERPGGSVRQGWRRVTGVLRVVAGSIVRLTAIALTVRSQRLATRPVAPPADLVHAMAYMGIPIGLDLGRRDGVPVLYDARDIYVQARNIARLPAPARRLFGAVERRWARRADRVMTVNRPYAEVLARSFGVPLPAIVMNCSYRRTPPTVAPRRLHEALDVDGSNQIVLYHGGLAPDRGIEQLIAMLPELPADVHLCLLGYGPLEASLDARAADPSLAGRLHVLPAVPPAELLDWVASADVVAMPIQPSTLNHRLTTPNKLFEAMAVGVPVVASDLPGMATIVRETGCGVLCDPTDPRSIAAAISSILEAPPEERIAIRDRALAAAAGSYSWEAQVDVLLAEYERLTGRPW